MGIYRDNIIYMKDEKESNTSKTRSKIVFNPIKLLALSTIEPQIIITDC